MLKSLRKLLSISYRNRLTFLIFKCNTCTNAFEDDFKKNHIRTTLLQRSVLTIGSAAASLLNPHRGDMIACLSETTGKQMAHHANVF